jgi:signal transduction histidine kinase
MRLKAEEKGQRIELDAGHFTVFVNRGNIWRVICNLIANAIKFSPSGTTIKVLMLKKENNVVNTVDDCGIGIPNNMHDKIFDMFTEAKRQGTIGEQPFGIGLAISKQIIEMHGGKIWFEGKPVNGTMFHVELPVQYLN